MVKRLSANMASLFKGAWAARVVDMTHDFFKLEAAGGIILVFFSALALIVANSPLYELYDYFLNTVHFSVGFMGEEGRLTGIDKSVLHWVNDGLMVIFFFLVGLEIKRELVVGALSERSKALLPLLTAMGGMAVPAFVYWIINKDNPGTLPGWAIPTATDIAFALGILSLLGNRVPVELKILLTAFAIIDDLGAIALIAAFYTSDLHTNLLLFCIVPIIGLFLANKMGVSRRAPYLLLGLILWLTVLQSGVHATLAGVVTALFIPVRVKGDQRSPAQRLEHDLHPWVAFAILPVFGFANAGVPFSGLGLNSFVEPVTLGIILGLIVGKQVGIFGTVFLCVKSGLCPMPANTNWCQIYAMAVLNGIGFTMSLFIGGLAFEPGMLQAEVRLGVLSGSFISAIAGYILLSKTCPNGGACEKAVDPVSGR